MSKESAMRFEEFWSAYPKRVGREAAEKKFFELDVSDEQLREMLDAVKRQKRSEQWSRDNGRYIPNPATWLADRRWEDAVLPEATPSVLVSTLEKEQELQEWFDANLDKYVGDS